MNLVQGILGILLLFTLSCTRNSSSGYFSKEGVSFIYPQGWSINEEEDLDGEGYYLSVEKKGLNESGIVQITWFDVHIDNHEYLEIMQKEYKNQKLFYDLKFETAKNSHFNGIESIACKFSFKILGLRHRGAIYIFSDENKTFSFVTQEALEDIQKNKEGFELIRSTFKTEPK
ncbi:MAG TPA: hypothetical protein PKA53_04080 [Sphingobacterium sp.]|nr:hypothetical protein [Sphingobacterium sp.]